MAEGMGIKVTKNNRETNVNIFALGNNTRQALSIPEMAPLALYIGIWELRSVIIWLIDAKTPQMI